MISLDYIRRLAWGVYTKHGTAVSRAFLIALNETPTPWVKTPYKKGDIVSAETYQDLKECFSNTSSPMDWLS